MPTKCHIKQIISFIKQHSQKINVRICTDKYYQPDLRLKTLNNIYNQRQPLLMGFLHNIYCLPPKNYCITLFSVEFRNLILSIFFFNFTYLDNLFIMIMVYVCCLHMSLSLFSLQNKMKKHKNHPTTCLTSSVNFV